MQSKIGTDIIEIGRIRQAADLWGERFLNRIYTDVELEICGEKAASLAARFAGKEAVMKLLGARGVSWREIEILADGDGQPYVKLHGNTRSLAEALGIGDIDISLSHSREYAVATAIGTGQPL